VDEFLFFVDFFWVSGGFLFPPFFSMVVFGLRGGGKSDFRSARRRPLLFNHFPSGVKKLLFPT
jgi:hypothetical protein